MTGQTKLCFVVLLAAVLVSWGCSQSEKAPAGTSSNEAASIQPFLGRWDLTIKTPKEDSPSWVEISEEQGQAKGLMTGFWGHAIPTGDIQVSNGEIEFAAPKGVGYSDGMQFKGKLENGQLAGTITNPKGAAWQWTGKQAPSLQRTGVPEWGKPVRLFNGRNLDGWKLRNPGPGAAWSVKHGAMVKDAKSSDIISTSKFEDFKLHAEFKCDGSCNSGVYLRGRYEVQIAEPDEGDLPPNRSLGAVYGFIAPNPAATVKLGKWQSYDITLAGRTLTVVLDGKTIIDQKEIPGITGGALDSDEGAPGPIYLQGGEHGEVAFRNIVITPAK
jgi:3-keto-disaccharide hydrolase